MFEIWYNTNRHRDGRYLAENRTSSYQQIHAHKPLFGNLGKKGKVLNLGHLDFDIVSDFDIRISDFASLGIFTLVKNPLQIAPFMQNKANFRKSQMNVNPYNTTYYENKSNWTLGENEPNTNPIKANLLKAKMNVSTNITKDYENKLNWALFENKPNTNPIQTQYKPNQKRRGEQNCISSRKATLFPKKPQNLSGKMPDPA